MDEERLRAALDRALVLRYERQASRDVVYSLRKIVDIAVRAISPGINDPTTAVHALSHASALLCDLLEGSGAARRHRDADGVVRLVVPDWRPVDPLRLALEEPMQFASGQPAVLRRLAGLLREVAWRSPGGCVDAALVRSADRLAEIARSSTDVSPEETQQWCTCVRAALDGRWPAGRCAEPAPRPVHWPLRSGHRTIRSWMPSACWACWCSESSCSRPSPSGSACRNPSCSRSTGCSSG